MEYWIRKSFNNCLFVIMLEEVFPFWIMHGMMGQSNEKEKLLTYWKPYTFQTTFFSLVVLWYLYNVGRLGNVIIILQINIWNPWKLKSDQHVAKGRAQVTHATISSRLPKRDLKKRERKELAWHRGKTTKLPVQRTEFSSWINHISFGLCFCLFVCFIFHRLDYIDRW